MAEDKRNEQERKRDIRKGQHQGRQDEVNSLDLDEEEEKRQKNFLKAQRKDEELKRKYRREKTTAQEKLGKTIKIAGTATQIGGKTTELTGKAIRGVGKGTQAMGKGMTKAGEALSATKIGAILGIPLAAVGGATTTAGKATEAGGKTVEKTGRFTKRLGKKAKERGKRMERKGRMAKIIKRPTKTLSSFLLKISWYNLPTSLGLTLFYINLHFICRYIAAPFKDYFCRFGEEWLPKVSSGIKILKKGSKALEYAEIIAMVVLDFIVVTIILAIILIIMAILDLFEFFGGEYLIIIGDKLLDIFY